MGPGVVLGACRSNGRVAQSVSLHSLPWARAAQARERGGGRQGGAARGCGEPQGPEFKLRNGVDALARWAARGPVATFSRCICQIAARDLVACRGPSHGACAGAARTRGAPCGLGGDDRIRARCAPVGQLALAVRARPRRADKATAAHVDAADAAVAQQLRARRALARAVHARKGLERSVELDLARGPRG